MERVTGANQFVPALFKRTSCQNHAKLSSMFSANLPNNDADPMPKEKDQWVQWVMDMKEYISNQRRGKNCLVDRQKLPR